MCQSHKPFFWANVVTFLQIASQSVAYVEKLSCSACGRKRRQSKYIGWQMGMQGWLVQRN